MPNSKSDIGNKKNTWDPVFLHARREAVVILVLFAVCLVWSMGVCYFAGYLAPGEDRPHAATVLGIPAWAFWGILVPWLAVDAFTIWFCFFFMKDDDLGVAHEGEDLAEQIEHERASEGKSRNA